MAPESKLILTPLFYRTLNDTILFQNNGRIAHQEVDHVHFHIIPKPSASDEEGLVIGWPTKKLPMDELKALHAELLQKL